MQARPGKSVLRKVGPLDERPFCSFEDLARWVVELGLAASVEEVRKTKYDLWGDMLFKWYTGGQIACVFAQGLARNPDAARWASVVVEGDWNAEHVSGVVEAAAAEGVEALQLLFPVQNSAEQALEITRKLCAQASWFCVENGWLDGENGDSIQIGLRWVPKSKKFESWALGIADFDPMAFTRRFVGAPFIAIVLRPSQPMPDRAAVPAGTKFPASHLAHMDDGLGVDKQKRDKWMNGTSLAKRALILPDPLSQARAKVTFAFPSSARAEIDKVLASSAEKTL